MRSDFDLIISKIENKKNLYLGIAAAILSSVIAAIVPYIYGRLVDVAINQNSQVKTIALVIFLWFGLSLINNLLSRFVDKKSYEIHMDVFTGLSVDFINRLILLPMKFHKEEKIRKVIKNIEIGIEMVGRFIENTIFNFIPSIISFFIALVILLFVEWRLGIILVASAILYIWITLVYMRGITKKQKTMNRAWDKAYNVSYDAILNVDAVKLSTNEIFENKRIAKSFNSAGELFKNWRSIWLKISFWQGLIFTISFVMVMGGGILMLHNNSITAGKLIMFIGYVSLFTSPLSHLADQYRNWKVTKNYFQRATRYYNITPEKDFAFSKNIENLKGKIVFNNVNFGYKKDKFIIKDISFDVKPGESVALVGESGVGKSTIIGLIGRYYSPQKGEIFIDDIDIKKIKLKSLRDQMALVPQEILLFNDTIRNNILYGRVDASDKEIIEAAKAANAHDFIEDFPKKYDTIVGERGIKLSTGQKQRIAIARAILRNPKILILDEATSAFDSVSEKLVQEALSRLIKNRTTFIIAHRLSTIQHADKIIVLEKGQIAEIGNHEELMKNLEGIYRNFWEMQTAIQKIKTIS